MLARIRKAQEENEGGFTLIELLVVMIIIGILAAIAIPVFLNQRKSARDAAAKSDIRNVATSLESYYTNNQMYVTVPAQTSTAPSTVVIGASGENNAKVSTGDTVTVLYPTGSTAANATAFCVKGDVQGATHAWYYMSDQGGLQLGTVTACTGYTVP